ncbi:MAG: LysR family transcriptional regulator [Hyphomicrobiaceae bacterium]|nr:LysR family transcriptional regulator [Hyphomicrobiaceae bacterium]
MRAPTTKQLRIVLEIARTGKISSAANALSVTGPAVTLQLQQLEAIIGMPLFERGAGRMRPTAAGEVVADCARVVEDRLKACVETLEEFKGLRAGRVSVGVVSTAKYFAPAALGAFKRTMPRLDLRLIVVNRGDVLKALASFGVDLAIMGRPPEDIPVESVVLGDHPHVIIAAAQHPLAGRRKMGIDSLAGETLLLREPGSGTRILTERVFGDAANLKTAIEIGSNETIKQAVMAGLGIALISGHTIAAELELERLAILDIVGLPIVRQWHVVRHRDKRLLPAADALWRFLEREGRSFLPEVGKSVKPRRK